VATLEQQIAQTRKRAETRTHHVGEVARLVAELGLYRALADELRTDRFQEFVLEEAFQELARGGSQRLQELTGRYSLRYRDGALMVVDHDNGDEERSTDTLSGGETFLASLALALQLSAQIQQAAGAVLLEALFIDEGFATLDAETLESAAGALEALRGSGRMVGIITHLRDLADRLPRRIVVQRRAEGSRLEVQVS
jgi:exonuclease SbcC